MVKLTDRCFRCLTAAMLVPLGRAPTWRFHTKLYKFGWSTFPNNACMKNRTELNLAKVFYVWLIYHIQDFWINLLNGYDIYFWLRDTANQPLWSIHTRPSNYVRTPETSDKGGHTICIWKRKERGVRGIEEAPIKFRVLIPQRCLNASNIIADARPVGQVLFWPMQMSKDGPRIISYASRSLSSTETRYSQTEKEAFALIWAC